MKSLLRYHLIYCSGSGKVVLLIHESTTIFLILQLDRDVFVVTLN